MKKAIITGASGTLGKEISKLLIKKEYKIINISRNESKLATNIKTDLTKDEDINQAIEIINKEHKDFNLLIHCSGVLHHNKIGEIKNKEIDDDFSVNIIGVIKLTDKLIPLIKENKGDIVIIGSSGSFKGSADSPVYNSAKHAVLGYVRSLQELLKKEGVRVIGFYPGGFKGQFHIKAQSPLEQETLMDPKDLAKLIVSFIELPKNTEVSEIIVNRRK